jgi:hypothetical protein
MNIVNAIQNRNLLSFVYDGFTRTVEPHTYGTDTKGHLALRAYQVSGGSESGEYVGWKLFHVQNMQSVTVQPKTFASARTGYKQGDKAFITIRAQL